MLMTNFWVMQEASGIFFNFSTNKEKVTRRKRGIMMSLIVGKLPQSSEDHRHRKKEGKEKKK